MARNGIAEVIVGWTGVLHRRDITSGLLGTRRAMPKDDG